MANCKGCKFYPEDGYCGEALNKISNRLFTCAFYEEKDNYPDTSKKGKKVFMVCDYCFCQLEIVADYKRHRELRCPRCGRTYEFEL